MSVVLTNLSNRLYEDSRFRLNASAGRFGIDRVRSHDWEDLRSTTFYQENRDILDQPTGMGFWLWKPHIILEALESVAEGDMVVYLDSGVELIASLEPLFSLCREGNPVLLFGNGNLRNGAWTKRDCFILMDCDGEAYWNAPQCDAACCLFQRSEPTLQFVRDWLRYCRDPRVITDAPNTCGKRNLPEFVEHRRDQSVLSLLAQRHGLPLFRMPTQFGNHYKMHPYRLEGEFNCVDQYRQEQVRHYAVIPYYNSPYPQLLDHHRQRKGGGRKKISALQFLVRVIRKRYNRWMNAYSLRRESHA